MLPKQTFSAFQRSYPTPFPRGRAEVKGWTRLAARGQHPNCCGDSLTCWGPLAAAGSPAPGAGQHVTHRSLHSHLARVLEGPQAAGWGQEAQVGGQAVAEEAAAAVSGAAAAVSCRRARRAESRMEQGEMVRDWQDSSLRRAGDRVAHFSRRQSSLFLPEQGSWGESPLPPSGGPKYGGIGGQDEQVTHPTASCLTRAAMGEDTWSPGGKGTFHAPSPGPPSSPSRSSRSFGRVQRDSLLWLL